MPSAIQIFENSNNPETEFNGLDSCKVNWENLGPDLAFRNSNLVQGANPSPWPKIID
jgi:hypothetical protein